MAVVDMVWCGSGVMALASGGVRLPKLLVVARFQQVSLAKNGADEAIVFGRERK